MDLLRFSTAGSVDDGKSTLIGRLLYDSKGVFEDQLEAVARSTVNRSAGPIDLSLLTDGLRAEREQGITIDVAYRYFATPKRKFIIADTPGHEQYTRNMATGASTAALAIVLIDARYGALVQSRRHTYIAALLGIPHVVVAVNKMDLVAWSQARFDAIVADFAPFLDRVGVRGGRFIPLSALLGDNVVGGSDHMPWYDGPPLLHHLETVDVTSGENLSALRFPVQYVIRPDLDFRGFAGQIAAGTVRRGDPIACLPAGTVSRVRRIHTLDGDVEVASAPRSVTLLLDDEIDVSRGDLIAHPGALPLVRRTFDADLVWMDAQALDPTRPYLVKHTTRTVRARVETIHHRVDVNSLAELPAATLQLNEIGKVRIACAQALFVDAYAEFRRTGSFIVIDPLTNATVGAGMVCGDQPDDDAALPPRVDRAAREAHQGHRAIAITIAGGGVGLRAAVVRHLETRLFQRGVAAIALDGSAVATMPGAADVADRLTWLATALCDAGHVAIIDGGDPAPGEDTPMTVALSDALAGVATEVEADPRDPDAAVRRILVLLADHGVFGAPRVVSPGAGI